MSGTAARSARRTRSEGASATACSVPSTEGPLQKRRLWTDGRLGILCLVGLDLAALFDAFALGYLLRFRWQLLPQEPVPIAPVVEYAKAWILSAAAAVAFFHAAGLYDRARIRGTLEIVVPLLRAGGAAILFLFALGYFYREFSYSRLAALYSALLAIVLVGGVRWAWESYRRGLRARGLGLRAVILVGGRRIGRFLARRLGADPSAGYRVAGVVDSRPVSRADFGAVPIGGFEDLPAILDSTAADEVLVAHPSLGERRLLATIETCERRAIPIRMVPATYDLRIDAEDFAEVGGIPLVSIHERRSRRLYRAVKRLVDFAVALCLGAALVPLLLLVASAIRLDSPGPILFRQRRVGRDGRPFEILKLRTMVVGAERLLSGLIDVDRLREPVFKLANDPRVTRVGRLLRRFGIDELPQLWNVLRGEMSLVGPRPEEEALAGRYDLRERRRLKLLPGITGLQQIHCRGTNSLEERLHWDTLYLRRESLLLDLWILCATLCVVLFGRQSAGTPILEPVSAGTRDSSVSGPMQEAP